ncbi:hypothetical protein [Oleidesulfovibrio alaskensis]|jgi:hypothetical protein|uniref:hypothetical protein n=1 Tax=Oleidesulfovibrio alaskensis TaxID=58180 RepID=UPI001A5CDB7D|nr:hypothetical protein [Oleidesulfovibrio alaskensis]MBL3580835.1 hypothetical protein [Oleidesulfovibrio alaskensis]MBL3587912.1 hypothetical protein [bacterium]
MDNCQQVDLPIHAERKGPNPIELAFVSHQLLEFAYLRKANLLWLWRRASGASLRLHPDGYAAVRGDAVGHLPIQ